MWVAEFCEIATTAYLETKSVVNPYFRATFLELLPVYTHER